MGKIPKAASPLLAGAFFVAAARAAPDVDRLLLVIIITLIRPAHRAATVRAVHLSSPFLILTALARRGKWEGAGQITGCSNLALAPSPDRD